MGMKGLYHNGEPVRFGLSLVTEPGEGWRGEQFIGEYDTEEELTKAINDTVVPEYWQLRVFLVDVHGYE